MYKKCILIVTITTIFCNKLLSQNLNNLELYFTTSVGIGIADYSLTTGSGGRTSYNVDVEAYTFIKKNITLGLNGALILINPGDDGERPRAFNLMPKLRYENSDDSYLSPYLGVGIGGFFQESLRYPLAAIDLGLKKNGTKVGVSYLNNRLFPEYRLVLTYIFKK